jgi:hypothetical protein
MLAKKILFPILIIMFVTSCGNSSGSVKAPGIGTVYADPPASRVGATIKQCGKGFTPNEDVIINVQNGVGQSVSLINAKASNDGTFCNSYVIPQNFNSGSYFFDAKGSQSGTITAVTSFWVTKPSAQIEKRRDIYGCEIASIKGIGATPPNFGSNSGVTVTLSGGFAFNQTLTTESRTNIIQVNEWGEFKYDSPFTVLDTYSYAITDNASGVSINGTYDLSSPSWCATVDVTSTPSTPDGLPQIIIPTVTDGLPQIIQQGTETATPIVIRQDTPVPTITNIPTAIPIHGLSNGYDFVANMCEAKWYGEAGELPCPGTDGDKKGFVLKVDSPQFKGGTVGVSSGLLTVPKHQFYGNGYIQGIYPVYKVKTGDRFHSTIGCESGATACYVTFRLDYSLSGSSTIYTYWAFVERYADKPYEADIDISKLAGDDIKFILTVLPTGNDDGDRALWGAPMIVNP